jgi:hypothetical protein
LKELNLKIAGINICYRFHNVRGELLKNLPKIYSPFIRKEEKDLVKIDVFISENISPKKIKGERIIFSDGKFWIQKNGIKGRNIIILYDKDKNIISLAEFDSVFKNGRIFNRDGVTFGLGHSSEFMLLSHPFDEIILINLLAKNRGFIMHGCGVNIEGNGYLFLGDSGKGKSTIAKMIKELDSSVKILNDERVILRKMNSNIYMFGQPWYSLPEFVSYGGIPLKKIFFLEHGDENKITELKKGKSLFLKLLAHIPFPCWDRIGMNFVMEIIAQIVNKIPCFIFELVKDPSKFNIEML